MIPRTVKVAAAVQSTLTAPQYLEYGNVILNGYLSTASGVSTAGATGAIASVTISSAGTNYTNGTYTGLFLSGGKGNYGYANVTVSGGAVTAVTITSGGSNFVVGQVLQLGGIPRTAPGTAATLTVATVNTRKITPALKGWTNNYSSYYTQLPPVAAPYSNTYPGMDAGGFEYMVHSFQPPTGPVTAIGFDGPQGYGYTDGVYNNVPTVTGRFGSGATLNIVIAGGQVQSVVLNNPGTGYQQGSTLSVQTLTNSVTALTITNPGAGYPPSAGIANRTTTALTGSGTGLRLRLTTDGAGAIAAASLSLIQAGTAGGTGYQVGDTVQVNGGTAVVTVTAVTPAGTVASLLGPGTGFFAVITGINVTDLGGQPFWSQRPVNAQSQVNSLFPLAGGGGGWIYPVADSPVAPPIDTL